MKINALELSVAGHQQVRPIHLQVVRLARTPMHPQLLQILPKPHIFFLKTSLTHHRISLLSDLHRNLVFRLTNPLELSPFLEVLRRLNKKYPTFSSKNSFGTATIFSLNFALEVADTRLPGKEGFKMG